MYKKLYLFFYITVQIKLYRSDYHAEFSTQKNLHGKFGS
jgi:hypothetical protein